MYNLYIIVLCSKKMVCYTQKTAATALPFLPNEPKYVIVLSYQRSGSSFFGQMFAQNSDAFYTYEPLDAVYMSLYGISAAPRVSRLVLL